VAVLQWRQETRRVFDASVVKVRVGWALPDAEHYRLNRLIQLSNRLNLWPVFSLFSERGSVVLASEPGHYNHPQARK
jgi:arginine/ornithine N-succinyltransferase beta subunit